MSSVVLGVAASHSTLMNTHWDRVVHRDRAERFRDALHAARDALAAAAPDAVVVIGSNHFRGFWLDLVPPFTMGVGEVVASGESGTPKGPLHVDVDLARALAQSVVDAEVDLAISARMQVDHGQTHAVQYLLAGLDVPLVPVVVNMFAPPLPTLRRCATLGRALRTAVEALPGDRRIAVVASGGLSHRLPWPDWRAPQSDDEHFMVEAWLNGRTHWEDYEGRRREIVLSAEAVIDEEWDRHVLELVEAGRLPELTSWTTERIGQVAGNGAQEVRAWVAMSAALGDAPGRSLAYEPMPEWLTGMAVAVVDPAAVPAAAVAQTRTAVPTIGAP